MPVYSLYSETRKPTAEMLQGLDVLVIDLQDVGTRIYTYIYTMANCLTAARAHGVPVIVCDRPNPIGGTQVEGPMLEPGYESFVGPVPDSDAPRHDHRRTGDLFNEDFGIGADLQVVHDAWMGARHVSRRGRSAVGDALAQHADAGHGHRLPGDGAVRGNERVRRARHDPAVRDGRARRGSTPSRSPTR